MHFIKKVKLQNWIDAIWWLLLSSVGALLPIWGLWLLLRIYSQPISLDTFTKNGELFLYSASIASASFYVISKDYVPATLRNFFKSDGSSVIKATFPLQIPFVLFFLFLICSSTLLFAGTTFRKIPGVSLPLDIGLINGLSVGIFLLTTILSYLVTALDNAAEDQTEADYRNLVRQNEENLSNDFDALVEE